MPNDESLVQRVRRLLSGESAVVEKKMFGGLTFMLQGNMCCGVTGARLVVRVGADRYEEALGQPGVTPMDFTGRPLKGFVYVSAKACASDEALHTWVSRAVEFAQSLPPK